MTDGVTEVKYDRFRRATARYMTESVTTKPQVTLHRGADLTELDAALQRERDRVGPRAPGFTAGLLAAIVAGTTSSRVNGTVAEQVISLHDGVDLGVAVDVDGSLVVPVIRNAQGLSVAEIGSELARLADAARARRLRPEDVGRATFTVTSLGPLGVEYFTPIVNPPQLAIIGIGAIRDQVAVVDGEIGVRRTIGLSLSFDHAATDGADAARALDAITRAIESPTNLRWVDSVDTSGQLAAPAGTGN
ncbi:2-oxo acid dehydrogenase subunit E2 [Gordonia sp. NPDC127522]|uniref:2-oxo acid dehydrogenase subunit E2 n=1 Tax=Gordonia sp. NPDC127522 TaxID=3345390 RepID=UPI003634E4ED